MTTLLCNTLFLRSLTPMFKFLGSPQRLKGRVSARIQDTPPVLSLVLK